MYGGMLHHDATIAKAARMTASETPVPIPFYSRGTQTPLDRPVILLDDPHGSAPSNRFDLSVRPVTVIDDAASALSAPGLTQSALMHRVAGIAAGRRDHAGDTEAMLAQAALEIRALREQLALARADARRDAMTGLPNRRALAEAFAAEDDRPRYLAICDVDHFKSVNDRYGHSAGDRVLQTIAATLASACPDHLVARYGGEEFALLFTGLSIHVAHHLLETARHDVARQLYTLDDGRGIDGIRLSAGMITLVPGETVDSAFERADRLLYVAKASGRDRLVRE